MRTTRADVGKTATWNLGDGGPRVLLVHGFRGSHHGLLGIAGAMPEVRFVIPDLPGFGKTASLAGINNLDAFADWLVAFSSEAGEFDAVLAHSFGTLVLANALNRGMSAKRVLLQNPITSNPRGGLVAKAADLFYRYGSAQNSSLLRSQLVVWGMSVALTTTLRPRLRRFIHHQHADHFSTFENNTSLFEAYQAASSSNVLDYGSVLPKKLRIVAGEIDVVAPVSGQRKLAELTAAPLRIIPKVGHLTHYEKPDEVAEELAKLLGS
jgi:pimeloyl-ACP methyl ester carboxylesterase